MIDDYSEDILIEHPAFAQLSELGWEETASCNKVFFVFLRGSTPPRTVPRPPHTAREGRPAGKDRDSHAFGGCSAPVVHRMCCKEAAADEAIFPSGYEIASPLLSH